MNFKHIGEVLQAVREYNGWSKAEMSRRTGYHTSSIRNMEKGSGHVLWSRYAIYMHHLGLTWDLVPKEEVSDASTQGPHDGVPSDNAADSMVEEGS